MPSTTLSPKKLLLTKWTAVAPVAREKHWVVVKVVAPEPPAVKVEDVVLEAVHSGRSVTLPWRALKDTGTWRQGWV